MKEDCECDECNEARKFLKSHEKEYCDDCGEEMNEKEIASGEGICFPCQKGNR